MYFLGGYKYYLFLLNLIPKKKLFRHLIYINHKNCYTWICMYIKNPRSFLQIKRKKLPEVENAREPKHQAKYYSICVQLRWEHVIFHLSKTLYMFKKQTCTLEISTSVIYIIYYYGDFYYIPYTGITQRFMSLHIYRYEHMEYCHLQVTFTHVS